MKAVLLEAFVPYRSSQRLKLTCHHLNRRHICFNIKVPDVQMGIFYVW